MLRLISENDYDSERLDLTDQFSATVVAHIEPFGGDIRPVIIEIIPERTIAFHTVSSMSRQSASHPSARFSRSISCGYRPDRQHRRDSPRLGPGQKRRRGVDCGRAAINAIIRIAAVLNVRTVLSLRVPILFPLHNRRLYTQGNDLS
jgi:hypothetical protein